MSVNLFVQYQYPYKSTYKITCPFKKAGSWSAGYHIGVDLVGTHKNVYPICEGFVQSINNKGASYGNHILIKQIDGNVALYAHLSKINVKINDKVNLITAIGVEGSTGNSSGSHLHLELHKNAYKYPKKDENATWLLNPLDIIGRNLAMDVNTAKKEIKEKLMISDATIAFLDMYKYGNELLIKIAKGLK